jgi:hypothetical protein
VKECRRREYGGKKFDDMSVLYDETIRISIAAAAAAASIPPVVAQVDEVGPGSRFGSKCYIFSVALENNSNFDTLTPQHLAHFMKLNRSTKPDTPSHNPSTGAPLVSRFCVACCRQLHYAIAQEQQRAAAV